MNRLCIMPISLFPLKPMILFKFPLLFYLNLDFSLFKFLLIPFIIRNFEAIFLICVDCMYFHFLCHNYNFVKYCIMPNLTKFIPI